MKPIDGETRTETWFKAAQYLRQTTDLEDFNLVLEVRRPGTRTATDRAIERQLDNLLRDSGSLPINSVADTIFPAKEYQLHGSRGVYEVYPNEVYPGIRPTIGWGTYAQRLVRGVGRGGKTYNPLQLCVDKLKVQLGKDKGGKKACYELSLASVADDAETDLPTYRAASDQRQTLGLPCLSHVSLKITGEQRLNLTALYRSHYYIERALGNLLGLARLQGFICKETGLRLGTLVCVSTYARLDLAAGRGIQKLDQFFKSSVAIELSRDQPGGYA